LLIRGISNFSISPGNGCRIPLFGPAKHAFGERGKV